MLDESVATQLEYSSFFGGGAVVATAWGAGVRGIGDLVELGGDVVDGGGVAEENSKQASDVSINTIKLQLSLFWN